MLPEVGQSAGAVARSMTPPGGDILESVDGRPASSFSLNELREMLKEEGRSYRMTLRRGGRPFRVDLTLRRLL